MVAATPGVAVQQSKRTDPASRRNDLESPNGHSLEDLSLFEYGKDRASTVLNSMSARPDATAVRFTPDAKQIVGKDAHAVADAQGAAVGRQIAQEVRAAGGPKSEDAAIAAGNAAREQFKNYARGEGNEEERLNKRARQPQQDNGTDLLAQDQTDVLPEARGKRANTNVIRTAGGLRLIGAALEPETQLVAQAERQQQPGTRAKEPAPQVQPHLPNTAQVQAAAAQFRSQWESQQLAAELTPSRTPYRLDNFRAAHARVTIIGQAAQEQENLA